MNDQLTHNKTYAHRLPPTLIEQARHWANFHEQGVFSDPVIGGIGNSAFRIHFSREVADHVVSVAGRTILESIVHSLERIDYDGDPLQFLVESTTYQPFISLLTQTEMFKGDSSIFGIRECGQHSVCISLT